MDTRKDEKFTLWELETMIWNIEIEPKQSALWYKLYDGTDLNRYTLQKRSRPIINRMLESLL
jgi:hypothetical protein